MRVPRRQQRAFLIDLAVKAMLERGFEPEFSLAALDEVRVLEPLTPEPGPHVRDLRALLWCSIDNDDSRDLDQLTAAEPIDDGIRIYIAIADVSATVGMGSAIDQHAQVNTTSVYTPPRVFAMLPERLSTDLTSLNLDQDRLALVVQADVLTDGELGGSAVYRAVVRNHAQLAYGGVGTWLEQKGPLPHSAGLVAALADNLRLQDRAAQSMEAFRHDQGALDFASTEVKAELENDAVHSLHQETRSRAQELIENFMIIANGVIARFLADHRFPVMRRVVLSPERWPRIVAIAEHLEQHLPSEPDAKALQQFMTVRRRADPLRYPDLSLSIVKLLGRGEYVASFPDRPADGHFGLAVSDYTHSTAPNRRYPDLITQRLVRAALEGRSCPYERQDLERLAQHCTDREDEAKRVERRLVKSAAALLLGDRHGEVFDGLVTGAGQKGTWVRVFNPPVEGRVERGSPGLEVGDRVRVRLIRTDPVMGFIDFERVGHEPIGRRS